MWRARPWPQIRMACPYCYQVFLRWRIQFRCSGRPSRLGDRCDPGADPVYSAFYGPGFQLPVFPARRRYAADCPHCGSETTVRVCPNCHHRLPTHFGRVRSRLVALVGASDSGKTVYLTVLMHELNHRAGERLESGVWGADEETRRIFAGEYERPMYTDGDLPGTTRPVGAEQNGLRPPLVFSFATEGSGLRRSRRTLLSFFDTAGEDLTSEASVELNTRYLRSADAVLLVLDPLQMAGGRARAGHDVRPPERPAVDNPFQVLQKITDLLQDGRRAGKVSKPLGVAFSKVDVFWDWMAPAAPLRRAEPVEKGVDERDGLDVNAQVQVMINDWDGRQIDTFLRANYRCFRYFGFSALGNHPTGTRVPSVGIAPYRVADPFLWLLAELGAVRIVRRR